jgi:hypothetical protein
VCGVAGDRRAFVDQVSSEEQGSTDRSGCADALQEAAAVYAGHRIFAACRPSPVK